VTSFSGRSMEFHFKTSVLWPCGVCSCFRRHKTIMLSDRIFAEITKGRHFWPYKGMQHIVWRHISIISSCFTLGVSFHAQQRGRVCYLTKYTLFPIGILLHDEIFDFVMYIPLPVCMFVYMFVKMFVSMFSLYRPQFLLNCLHITHIRSLGIWEGCKARM